MTEGLTIFLMVYATFLCANAENLPVDEMEASNIADEILANPPVQGFLTISNALQWRLQYTRVIDLAGQEEGLIAIYREN